ncbi:unnamed protein product [Musa hybrid cultivar]
MTEFCGGSRHQGIQAGRRSLLGALSRTRESHPRGWNTCIHVGSPTVASSSRPLAAQPNTASISVCRISRIHSLGPPRPWISSHPVLIKNPTRRSKNWSVERRDCNPLEEACSFNWADGFERGVLPSYAYYYLGKYHCLSCKIGTGTPQSRSKISKAVKGNDQLCTLCENFTAQATQYIGENKTQTELLETLHQACSEMKPFEEQCILLVDFYASLFFAEISKIHPEEFCKKFDLCEEMDSINLRTSDDSCSLCHDVVAKVFIKLKDPDTQFEVIKMLLKECNEVENYVKECKKLVLQYGPLILVNGEKFLENTDVCTAIHACKTSKVELISTVLVAEY